MNFSEGIEPTSARDTVPIGPGQVIFKSIEKIAAGERWWSRFKPKQRPWHSHLPGPADRGNRRDSRNVGRHNAILRRPEFLSASTIAADRPAHTGSNAFGCNSGGAFAEVAKRSESITGHSLGGTSSPNRGALRPRLTSGHTIQLLRSTRIAFTGGPVAFSLPQLTTHLNQGINYMPFRGRKGGRSPRPDRDQLCFR